MKIDLSLIRQILLKIESEILSEEMDEIKFLNSKAVEYFTFLDNSYYSQDKNLEHSSIIAYHLKYLSEGDIVQHIEVQLRRGGEFMISVGDRPDLTFKGHSFLNSIREEAIFKKVLSKLSKVGDTATLEIVTQLAKTTISQTLGLDS